MSRLTNKSFNGTLYSENGYQCLEKLYILEDIEEKLGYPLEVYIKELQQAYKILKEGILVYINFADINFLESNYKGKLIVEGRIFGTDFNDVIDAVEYGKIKKLFELLEEQEYESKN